MRYKYGVSFAENPTEYMRRQSASRRADDPVRQMLNHARYRAKKREIDFSVEAADLHIPELCPIMDIPLFFSEGKRTDNTPSLDRVDNSKGYTPGNSRVISWLANNRKGDLTVEQIDRLHNYVHGRD